MKSVLFPVHPLLQYIQRTWGKNDKIRSTKLALNTHPLGDTYRPSKNVRVTSCILPKEVSKTQGRKSDLSLLY